ncbi:MAG: ParB/RepB/Spo0J family partition protein [Proteobacteria bacterium]|nr:ParB/RepB/Spo0J family partition protein [Pseudomonadota bacterium]
MAEEKRQNLGRGLSALMGEDSGGPAETDNARSSRLVPVERLLPGRYQPRHSVDEEKISELAQSVRENGIIQPLLVRRHSEDKDSFEIIAGERRWRAAQMAKLHEVPVIIRDLSDQQALEIALVENLQRQDLSSLEEAEGYQRLMDEFSHTQEDLAKTVGKSRSHVANMMRLLGLPPPVKKMLDTAELSAGHARALLNAPDPLAAARQVVKKGLNVRQTERLVRKKQRQEKAPPRAEKKDVDTLALERDLGNLLGLKVAITHKGDGGSLTVHYRSLEQLDDVLHRLSQGATSRAPSPPEKEPEKKKPRKTKPKLSFGLKSARAGKKEMAG